jgi:hypothetical protein
MTPSIAKPAGGQASVSGKKKRKLEISAAEAGEKHLTGWEALEEDDAEQQQRKYWKSGL